MQHFLVLWFYDSILWFYDSSLLYRSCPPPTSQHHCLQDALLRGFCLEPFLAVPSCPDSLLLLGILQINHRGWSQRVAAAALSAPSCVYVSLPPGFLSSSAGKPCHAKMLLMFVWILRHSCDETFGNMALWHTHTSYLAFSISSVLNTCQQDVFNINEVNLAEISFS